MSELTQKRLKEVLNYNSETGLFVWIVRTTNGIKVGDVAGNKDAFGYIRISIDSTSHKAHRLAWLHEHGEFPHEHMDHINHIRNDNRICNLRCVTQAENNMNMSMPSTNKSGVVGVHQRKVNGSWLAYISSRKNRVYLGSFWNKEDAIKARERAEIEHGYHHNHGGV